MIFTYFSRGMGVYYQSFTQNEFGVLRLDLRQSAHSHSSHHNLLRHAVEVEDIHAGCHALCADAAFSVDLMAAHDAAQHVDDPQGGAAFAADDDLAVADVGEVRLRTRLCVLRGEHQLEASGIVADTGVEGVACRACRSGGTVESKSFRMFLFMVIFV